MASIHAPLSAPQATKSASICYLNYGEGSRYAMLFQEPLRLEKALEGYSCCVLLLPEALPGWAELSEHDQQHAAIKDRPTKTNLFKYIVQLAAGGYCIDLFLFAHGWHEQFGARIAGPGSEDRVSVNDIENELDPQQTGFSAMPIRVVWGSNSYGHTLGEAWRSVGAKAIAGVRYVNFYPNSWNQFIDRWNSGNLPFNAAVAGATTESVRAAAQSYISLVDAPAQKQRGAWRGCAAGKPVLGEDCCARDYFVSCWLAEDEWQGGMGGKENMNYSSYMFRSGEKQLTKNARQSWS